MRHFTFIFLWLLMPACIADIDGHFLCETAADCPDTTACYWQSSAEGGSLRCQELDPCLAEGDDARRISAESEMPLCNGGVLGPQTQGVFGGSCSEGCGPGLECIGGLCSSPCTPTAAWSTGSCPQGAICLRLNEMTGWCVAQCERDEDCTEDARCDVFNTCAATR